MKSYNLALLGFGNVGRALVQLLHAKQDELLEKYDLAWKITGVASRRLGFQANPASYDPAALLAGHFDQPTATDSSSITNYQLPITSSTYQLPITDLATWLAASNASVLFENTSMDPFTGQPAIGYITTALEAGVHVITANKGPVVHAYHELKALAESRGVHFLHEAAVMGGAPIFSLFREALPAANLHRFTGILNSTTNLMLTEMERGASFDEAVKKAQDLGIAETDPSFDVDGWDATVKVSALATVLMNYPLKPQDIQREGIRHLSADTVRTARMMGRPYKLVCQAARQPDGTVTGSVRPEQVPVGDPLAHCEGATSLVVFQMDVIHGLTLSEVHPDAGTTAYGPLADLITIAKSR